MKPFAHMKTKTCFFEDAYLENFHPLTLTRPIYDLRVGILTLGQKWHHALGIPDMECRGVLRQHLKGVFTEFIASGSDEEIIWLNPRYIPVEVVVEKVESLKSGQGLFCDDELIAGVVTTEMHNRWIESGMDSSDLEKVDSGPCSLTIVENSWELFQINGQQIRYDVNLLDLEPLHSTDDYLHSIFTSPDNIYIEKGAVIEPGAMLLADSGPIYVGKDAHIMANSIIRGASAICRNSVIKMGARIYEDTTVGPVCKIGGEVANTIFHSYSNKAHDGYAGNSVFGQWCNLGADTNTSNLKNNYSTVKVSDWKTGKQSDTGQQFIGTIMGDHSKTGINSMLNTGTLCGVCCNLFSDKYPPKFVPSFSWVSGSDIVPYHFEKAVDAMEKMMERRSVELTPAYESMMKAIFQSTSF